MKRGEYLLATRAMSEKLHQSWSTCAKTLKIATRREKHLNFEPPKREKEGKQKEHDER